MALRHLSLRNFVIVTELELDLHRGFSVLTGETGAGKSILVDALQLVLGGRGDALWVRHGQTRCDLAAEFDAPHDAQSWLEANGFDTDGDALLMRRTIDAAGKSRAWINGAAATVAQLRELAQWLVDIHGQHAWQSLTRPAAVRALLDAYAGVDTAPLQEAWQAWHAAQSALELALAAQDSLSSERERLLWQIGEIDKLAPQIDEWDALNQQHTRLSHAQALTEAAQGAAAALDADDGQGALPALAQVQDLLQAQRQIEPEFAALLDVLQNCEAQLQDVARTLHAYQRDADLDPEQFSALDARIGQWVALARRYRRTPEQLPELLASWRVDLARLESSADLTQMQARVEEAHAAYQQLAQQVSTQRRAAAPRLAASVTAAMQTLGMAGGVFAVQLEPVRDPAAHGLESATFLVSAHAGAPPRAIERVASGGELSRLALAIAVTTSTLGSAATLVFDEVDAGVGGAVAATVGQLLHRLGQDRQVLCVTHLPQVAACAHHHLLVSKTPNAAGETLSTVTPIDGEARTNEIGRMLGGERLTDATLAHAREMLSGYAARPVPKKPSRASARKERA